LARSPQIPDEFVVYHHILVEGWRRSKQSLFSRRSSFQNIPPLVSVQFSCRIARYNYQYFATNDGEEFH
jgi:hypothetical protein